MSLCRNGLISECYGNYGIQALNENEGAFIMSNKSMNSIHGAHTLNLPERRESRPPVIGQDVTLNKGKHGVVTYIHPQLIFFNVVTDNGYTVSLYTDGNGYALD